MELNMLAWIWATACALVQGSLIHSQQEIPRLRNPSPHTQKCLWPLPQVWNKDLVLTDQLKHIIAAGYSPTNWWKQNEALKTMPVRSPVYKLKFRRRDRSSRSHNLNVPSSCKAKSNVFSLCNCMIRLWRGPALLTLKSKTKKIINHIHKARHSLFKNR